MHYATTADSTDTGVPSPHTATTGRQAPREQVSGGLLGKGSPETKNGDHRRATRVVRPLRRSKSNFLRVPYRGGQLTDDPIQALVNFVKGDRAFTDLSDMDVLTMLAEEGYLTTAGLWANDGFEFETTGEWLRGMRELKVPHSLGVEDAWLLELIPRDRWVGAAEIYGAAGSPDGLNPRLLSRRLASLVTRGLLQKRMGHRKTHLFKLV
jgi:hypothetical protein